MRKSMKRAVIAALALTTVFGSTVIASAEDAQIFNDGKEHTIQLENLDVKGDEAVGTWTPNTKINIEGNDITITNTSDDMYGVIDAESGTVINLGTDSTQNIIINAKGNGATGLNGYYESNINVYGKQLTVDADAYGIWVQNDDENLTRSDSAASITINSKNTKITAGEQGLLVYSGSKLTINNSLTVTAPDAISTRGNSTININQDGTGTVHLNGDINFESGETVPNSGAIAASNVNINLGENGTWEGSSKVTGYKTASDNNSTGEKASSDKSTGLSLTIPKGAKWTSTGSSFAQNLTLTDGGEANVADTLTIRKSLQVGAGSTVTAKELDIAESANASSEEGSMITADTLAIKENAKVNFAGTTNINKELTSAAGTEVNITNLNLADGATTALAGKTVYEPTAISADKVKKISASGDVEVNVDNASVASTGLKVGKNTVAVLEDADKSGKTTITGNNKEKAVSIGSTLQGTGKAVLDGSNVNYEVTVDSEAQPQTHKATMAQAGSLAAVIGGFDMASRAVGEMESDGISAFASVGGGEDRYDTGSHIKTNIWHAVAGVGIKNTAQSGSSTEYGLFYDYGDGNYRTYDGSGRGDGDVNYKGGGLFGKYTFDSKLYVEGSFRAGRVKNEADGVFHDASGNRYNLKTDSNYNAFHLGVGKVLEENGNDSLDVYGKYFHTHVNGDSFDAGGHYDLDSVDSDLLRIGARYNMKRGLWNHYVGLAYEYEFDGEADGTADGAHIERADIGGSSARLEIGTAVDTGKWTIGFNADAYMGQHRGYDGYISAGLKF